MAAFTIMAELNLSGTIFQHNKLGNSYSVKRSASGNIWIASGVLFLHLLGANSMDNTLGLS